MNFLKYTATVVALSLPLMAAKCELGSYAVKVCSALDSIYAHYDEVKADGVIPVRYTRPVDALRSKTDKACANPSSVSSITLAGLAGETYIALKAALKAGEGEGDADYEATEGLNKLEDLKAYLQKMKQE